MQHLTGDGFLLRRHLRAALVPRISKNPASGVKRMTADLMGTPGKDFTFGQALAPVPLQLGEDAMGFFPVKTLPDLHRVVSHGTGQQGCIPLLHSQIPEHLNVGLTGHRSFGEQQNPTGFLVQPMQCTETGVFPL